MRWALNLKRWNNTIAQHYSWLCVRSRELKTIDSLGRVISNCRADCLPNELVVKKKSCTYIYICTYNYKKTRTTLFTPLEESLLSVPSPLLMRVLGRWTVWFAFAFAMIGFDWNCARLHLAQQLFLTLTRADVANASAQSTRPGHAVFLLNCCISIVQLLKSAAQQLLLFCFLQHFLATDFLGLSQFYNSSAIQFALVLVSHWN